MHSHRLLVLPATILLFASLPSCSKQGEGDRCLRSNGNSDCDSGLVCVASDELADSAKNPQFSTDRCCPEDGHSSDSRCARGTSETDISGVGGEGNAGGAAGVSGSANLEGGSANLGGASANLGGASTNLEGGSTNLEGGSAGAGG
jgi:hypothetical protein